MSVAQEQIQEPSLDGDQSSADDLDQMTELLRLYLSSRPIMLLDLLADALQRARASLLTPPAKCHLVHVPDDYGKGTVTTLNTFDELLTTMRARRSQGGQMFAFRGDLLLPSRGGHYLVAPEGRYPLFVSDDETEVDVDGFIGPVPPILQPVPAPAASVVEILAPDVEVLDHADDDDDFDDEGNDDEDEDEGVEDDD